MAPSPEPLLQIPEEETAGGASRYRWYQKLGGLLAVIFCFEIGLFLTIFPWLDSWDSNFFSSFPRGLWTNPYFRGAISGIGIIDVYISLIEVFRLRRFSE